MKAIKPILFLRNHFWFIPALYGTISVVLAIATALLDQFLHIHLFLINKSLAQSLLSTIASSLLTMTTISFSTIMVVLTTYLSQFSPRTMQDFLTDINTQRILGVFIGGFLYSLILLLLLQNDKGDYFISPIFAVFYAMICVGFFVFFIHHVGKWIQVSNLMHHITSKTIHAVHQYYEDEELTTRDEPWKDWESEEIKLTDPLYIQANHSGYLLVIEIDELIAQASADDSIVKVEVSLGDYIEKGMSLLSYWGNRDKVDHKQYRKSFHLADERATIQDIDFGLTKLVEITLRALSPGINDPNTAINGIKALARILSTLASKNLHRSYYNDDYKSLRVINKQRSFSDYLYRCYYQIKHYGIEDISVVAAMIDSLALIASQNNQEIKQLIWDFSQYIQLAIHSETLLDLDRSFINSKLKKLAIQTNQFNHFKPL
ncbi:DUF2254 domain-containing protein [Halalkalibacter sp. APA_J-10(15)]|uniref:DUF2254 domain-containing protein n=1 Tax=unclassified Halalkalibacter TaxID=2893063 RepID=UPI001FF59A2D|nr:DUF2254 domain-containing protein [Halalkalibacter sp. APA_J-10(15)]MCK0473945.1 DUF2254 domain-containing protein [Halalkalibacter sp. APA_J-10(15)]